MLVLVVWIGPELPELWSGTMTVHTIGLEQQGKSSDDRLTLSPAFRTVRHVAHNRCQHEARGRRGIIRQCRNKSVTVIEGQRLCGRHAYPEGGR